MQRRRSSGIARGVPRALALVLISAVLLTACSRIDPVPDWTPPTWPDAAGVQLVRGDAADDTAAADPDTEETDTEATDTEAETEDLNDLGFIENRVRNDALNLSMRYVELPGIHAFNTRVAEVVSAAIASTGGNFVPEVFPVSAGLADRGCVAGSTRWPADRVLSDPLTGPTDGRGVAVTCEVTAAYGTIVGIAMRTVAGTPDKITSDTRLTLYADVSSGMVTDGSEMWSADAAPDLWTRAVELLRREAGGLSAAPIAEPNKKQLARAARAFEVAQTDADGGAVLTLPPGIAAPELEGLGITKTKAPTPVAVDAETLAGWQSEQAGLLQQQVGQPFVGLEAWDARQPVNCAIQACVAVTYDDGPTEFTDKLLDTLQAERTPATFFMLGSAASGRPEQVQRAASEGHEIASHTMTHPDLTTLKSSQVRREVNGAAKILSDLTGIPVTMYRPPYGALNQKVLNAEKLPAILWSIDTLDWKDPGKKALVERSVGVATPGDIILFHDTHSGSVDAAKVVMRGLKDRGFTPVTVTQLFGGSVPSGRVVSG